MTVPVLSRPAPPVEARVRDIFARDVARHEMKVLRDDGVYRHLRFMRPGDSTYYYDLVTWPGHLVITGDCGDYHFARITDMFEFFEGHAWGVNAGYWAQKLRGESGRAGARTYDEGAYRARVLEWYAEEAREILDLDWDTPVDTSAEWLARQWLALPYPDPLLVGTVHAAARYEIEIPEDSPFRAVGALDRRREMLEEAIALRDAVDEQLLEREDETHYEDGARQALAEFEHDGRRLHDTWEWDLREWDHHFLWCCWAIVHGIERYRAATRQAVAA